jgi:regulatory protein
LVSVGGEHKCFRRFPLGLRLWHKNGVKAPFKQRRAPQPLDGERLNGLALRYVGRFATTRAKLRDYLFRKLRERGWQGQGEPEVERIADRFAELGYIDDAAFAVAKSRSLSARGYGRRRLADHLRVAGVEEEDSAEAFEQADRGAIEAALRLAQRRRLGPFAPELPDRQLREKWIAMLVRAGHDFALARTIAALDPERKVNLDHLSERVRDIIA